MIYDALCFIDTETVGLDPDRHGVWEVAIEVVAAPDVEQFDGAREGAWCWQLPVDLAEAEAAALEIRGFHHRRAPRFDGYEGGLGTVSPPTFRSASRDHAQYVWPSDRIEQWAQEFARITWGTILIGAVPSFDEERLRRLLRRLGACPGWHYQPVDVETLVAGWLIGRARGVAIAGDVTRYPGTVSAAEFARKLPWKSDELCHLLRVKVDPTKRHTAAGDVEMAHKLWDRVMTWQGEAESGKAIDGDKAWERRDRTADPIVAPGV